MLMSQLFAGDDLLQRIADGRPDRISQTRNRTAPGVRKLQTALLIWRPDVLPRHGADGDYGPETAAAVVRFKAEELGMPAAQIINDVGPLTVRRLDEIAFVAESVDAAGVVVVGRAGASPEEYASIHIAIANAGGQVLLGLGEVAAVVAGGQAVVDALAPLVGQALTGIVTPTDTSLIPSLDEETAGYVMTWLAMLDPEFVLAKGDPERLGGSFASLGGCTVEEA
jgi:hypothetical protein